jgi:hypothetical protein
VLELFVQLVSGLLQQGCAQDLVLTIFPHQHSQDFLRNFVSDDAEKSVLGPEYEFLCLFA